MPSDDPAPDDLAWAHEESRLVLRALRDLPAEQRRVIVLGYFAGLSQSAMARELGIPLGTVKTRVRLGMQKLRAVLTDGSHGADDSQQATAPAAGAKLRVVVDE